MFKDVTVIDEVTNIDAAKIHADLDTRKRPGAVPKIHLRRIEILCCSGPHRRPIPLEQQKTDLVLMEFMDFVPRSAQPR
jgi:hypothetical protein